MSGLLLRVQQAAERILPRFDVTRAYVFGSQRAGTPQTKVILTCASSEAAA